MDEVEQDVTGFIPVYGMAQVFTLFLYYNISETCSIFIQKQLMSIFGLIESPQIETHFNLLIEICLVQSPCLITSVTN